jgi:hypothetical protein
MLLNANVDDETIEHNVVQNRTAIAWAQAFLGYADRLLVCHLDGAAREDEEGLLVRAANEIQILVGNTLRVTAPAQFPIVGPSYLASLPAEVTE